MCRLNGGRNHLIKIIHKLRMLIEISSNLELLNHYKTKTHLRI